MILRVCDLGKVHHTKRTVTGANISSIISPYMFALTFIPSIWTFLSSLVLNFCFCSCLLAGKVKEERGVTNMLTLSVAKYSLINSIISQYNMYDSQFFCTSSEVATMSDLTIGDVSGTRELGFVQFVCVCPLSVTHCQPPYPYCGDIATAAHAHAHRCVNGRICSGCEE